MKEMDDKGARFIMNDKGTSLLKQGQISGVFVLFYDSDELVKIVIFLTNISLNF